MVPGKGGNPFMIRNKDQKQNIQDKNSQEKSKLNQSLTREINNYANQLSTLPKHIQSKKTTD